MSASLEMSTSDQSDYALSPTSIPIAICGMALRLPGGISNPSQFWDFLVNKKDALARIPESRYNVSTHHPTSDGTTKAEYGYFLDESIDLGSLDTSFFSFTKLELEYIDPHQRQMLEVVRECFESAGEVDYRGKDIGCWVGSFSDDWLENLRHDVQLSGKYPVMIAGDFAVPNRVSYEYDLRGPSISVRTACSSTLVALHQACVAMERGECSGAIVGGCNLILSPTTTIAMLLKGILSPDGSCKTFDAAANGYARGEAVNAIYLKPLDAAIRDGNPIRAVIRGSAVNSDGKVTGFTVPSLAAHEALIRKAYRVAGINDLSQTAFVECHGTGTTVGDPIEATAVANAFGNRGAHLGSVKPNVGHSEGASGLTSLIKAVLAVENRTIPPNIKLTTPNPKIPFAERNLKVALDPVPWPQGFQVRASVNSFGMGGVNAHVVIDAADNFTPVSSPSLLGRENEARLLLFSANTHSSLEPTIEQNLAYLAKHPSALADMSYTLGARREHLPFRAASIVGRNGITTKTFPAAPSLPPDIVMVFTGQGAQWPRMAVELYECNSVFQQSLCGLDGILHALPEAEAPAWSIVEQIFQDPQTSSLGQASFAQPICTAIQIALVDLLRSLNVQPYAVIGHSSGELAAAYAAGRLTASECIISAYYRGLVCGEVASDGAMAAVGMSPAETKEFLIPGVVIACENSASSITISGDADKVRNATEAIHAARPDVLVRQLKVDRAYHSHHMSAVGERYRTSIEPFHGGLARKSPPIHFFSSVTGHRLDEGHLDARYWQRNLESPVLFHAALKSIATSFHQPLLFLEVGPHAALSGPVRQILNEVSRNQLYTSCLTRFKDSAESFLSAIGQLYSQNVPLDFNELTNSRGTGQVLTDLPSYCWQHTFSRLYRPRENREWLSRRLAKHELLGLRVVDSTDREPSWRNVLQVDEVPWLRDHRVTGNAVFPGVGYLLMAGEAVRQVNPCPFAETGLHVRQVMISTAMVLGNSSTEILTSLRKHRETDWFDFTISSHNGVSWTEHCWGQVQGDHRLASVQGDEKPDVARSIDADNWYRTLARGGVDYGPAFQGIRKLSSSTTEHVASGQVVSTVDETSTYYPVHPTKLDACVHLVYAAIHRGLEWEVDRLPVPTYIGEFHIGSSTSDLDAWTWAEVSKNGVISVSGEAYDSDGALVLKIQDGLLQPVGARASDRSLSFDNGARIQWTPDTQFLRLTDLIVAPPGWENQSKLLGDLTALCVVEAVSRLDAHGVSSPIPHLRRYQEWLCRQSCSIPESNIDTVLNQVLATPAAPCGLAIMKVLNSIIPICQGEIEPLEVLMSDETLYQLYNYINCVDRAALFFALGQQAPKQRILEIGAGTGGSTAKILSQTSYSTYTFTDVSAAFLPAAKERFKAYSNIIFKTLDITKYPLEQGFQPESFDLIIAANVLHATPSLHQTLVNVRKILHPQGTLLLEELYCETKFTNFIVGVLPGWWEGELDGRIDEPYVSPSRWESELQGAGFAGLDDLAYDTTPPLSTTAFMIASPQTSASALQKQTVLLCDPTSSEVAVQLQRQLRSRGYIVNIQSFDQPLPTTQQDVIVLVDTVLPFFYEIDAKRWSSFQSFLHNIQQSHGGSLWVTRSSQMHCADPRFSLSIGATRTARSEFGIDLATCEVDQITYTTLGLVIDVFEKFHRRIESKPILAEQEYVITEDTIHVGRLVPFDMQEELGRFEESSYEGNEKVLRPETGSSSQIEGLTWGLSTEQLILGDDAVEIKVDYAGVGSQDLLATIGKPKQEQSMLGLECAGIVSRVGSEVSGISPGDRVFAFGPGAFATRMVTDAARCVRIPDGLSLVDAASMPFAFSTAIHSLIDIGQIKQSQSILINSAMDGIGIAAVQIAQMLGAVVYAGVNTDDEVGYLTERHAVPPDHIFIFHEPSVVNQVIKATRGGVELVLNSLPGEPFQTACKCVAQCGRIIDLAGQHNMGARLLPFDLYSANVSYTPINMMGYIQFRPEEGKRLLNTVVDLHAQNQIHPIQPVQTFPAHAVKDCLRHTEAGNYIGGIRLCFKDQIELLKPVRPPQIVSFHSDASYLLVGGLGGLGTGLARWMVHNGARQLIFLSRHADAAIHNELFNELKTQGCHVTAIQGSVCDLSDVQRAISSAPKPLEGIFNITMVLRDESLLKMSLDEWEAAVGPKVGGTWNLHRASMHLPIKLFVLFSSLCGIIGNRGQGNYAAANTFMDSFVQYRHHSHLPASVIDIGAVEGIGHVAHNPRVFDRSRWLDHARLGPKQLFDAVTLAIRTGLPPKSHISSRGCYMNPAHIMTGFRTTKLLDGSNTASFVLDARFAAYTNNVSDSPDSGNSDGSTASGAKLKQFLVSAAGNPAILSTTATGHFVAREIAKWVFDLLLKPVDNDSEVDLSRSLIDVGLDSLAAVEMRTWWKSTLGLEISVLEILSSATFAALGEHAIRGLQQRFGVGE